MVSEASTAAAGDWSRAVYQALKDQGVTVVGFVPDGGMKQVIDLCLADPAMRTIPLTNESEGPCLMAGAWLGGARGCLIMQSTGVGNTINNATGRAAIALLLLSLAATPANTVFGFRRRIKIWPPTIPSLAMARRKPSRPSAPSRHLIHTA